MADPGRTGDECGQCGLCCKVFGDRITPTVMNLYSWHEQGRKDILCHFSACLENGTRINAADLEPGQMGDIVVVELRDPVTGALPPVCPFLRRVERTRYICSIHAVKPDMCCNYMPWIYGETYFPRCSVLRDREKRSPWSGLSSQDP
ncbi:MAG: YkgJ family cysteine cluster protein [Methanomicrobiales archaeon]|nr:YkgJ family cysteine cluster protein [Methanomicrobiales archaeon]NYT21751.1 YkgJ family cysteine cluster protein [Methanomicrobiales archaeon]